MGAEVDVDSFSAGVLEPAAVGLHLMEIVAVYGHAGVVSLMEHHCGKGAYCFYETVLPFGGVEVDTRERGAVLMEDKIVDSGHQQSGDCHQVEFLPADGIGIFPDFVIASP